MKTFIAIALVFAFPALGHAAIIADSVAEFQTAPREQPVQGRDNWYYGYWDEPAGGYVYADYDPVAHFTVEDSMDWSAGFGPAGKIWFSDPPSSLTMCSMYHDGAVAYGPGQHPPGRPARWPIRRWVAEVTGSVSIHGELQVGFHYDGQYWTTDASGVMARIFHNGVEIYTQIVPPYQDMLNYSGLWDVSQGDFIDFMIDSDGQCAGDWTHWTVIIEDTPEPVAEPAALGVLALVLLASRNRRT